MQRAGACSNPQRRRAGEHESCVRASSMRRDATGKLGIEEEEEEEETEGEIHRVQRREKRVV